MVVHIKEGYQRRLIEIVIKYQQNQEEEDFLEIVNKFKNLIQKYQKKIIKQEQKDFRQEILMKIHRIVKFFKISKNCSLPDNEKQFVKYIEVSIKNTYIDYLKKEKKQEILIEDEEKIEDKKDIKSYEEDILTEEDKKFLNLFLKNGQALTEKEVGKKLGISQQAVNKRKKKIYQKISK